MTSCEAPAALSASSTEFGVTIVNGAFIPDLQHEGLFLFLVGLERVRHGRGLVLYRETCLVDGLGS